MYFCNFHELINLNSLNLGLDCTLDDVVYTLFQCKIKLILLIFSSVIVNINIYTMVYTLVDHKTMP